MSRPVSFELASVRTSLRLMAGFAAIGAAIGLLTIFSAPSEPSGFEDKLMNALYMLAGIGATVAVGCAWLARGLGEQIERLPADQ